MNAAVRVVESEVGSARSNRRAVEYEPPHFDRWQFERPRRSPRFLEELLLRTDGVEGFQEIAPPIPRHAAPEWAFNDRFVLLLASGYSKNSRQVAKRVATLYYFFRCGWNTGEISSTLGLSQRSVEGFLQRATRRALTAWWDFKSGGPVENVGLRRTASAINAKKSGQPARERYPLHATTIDHEMLDRFVDRDAEAVEFVTEFLKTNPLADVVSKEAAPPRPAIGEPAIRFIVSPTPRAGAGSRKRAATRGPEQWRDCLAEARNAMADALGDAAASYPLDDPRNVRSMISDTYEEPEYSEPTWRDLHSLRLGAELGAVPIFSDA